MRGNLQKIMIGLVVVIVLAFIFFSGDSLVKLVDTIKQGTPFFIIAAVVAQLCKYLAQGRGFQACFNTVNGHISYRTGLSLVFGTFFMNTVAPSRALLLGSVFRLRRRHALRRNGEPYGYWYSAGFPPAFPEARTCRILIHGAHRAPTRGPTGH